MTDNSVFILAVEPSADKLGANLVLALQNEGCVSISGIGGPAMTAAGIESDYDISELLVVGDNPESEIKAGNNIGIETVQILREGIAPSKIANYRIKHLNELNKLIL